MENLSNQILSFKLYNQSYGTYINAVREIIKAPKKVSKNIDNPSIKGIISYRSGSLPIVDLGEKIENIVNDETEDRFIIVIEKENGLCGFLVEGMETIQEVKMNELSDVPNVGGERVGSYVDKILNRDDSIIPILKLNEMF